MITSTAEHPEWHGLCELQYAFFEPEDPEEGLRLLPLCGIGFPKLEACQILLTMKQLGGNDDYKVEAMRFFGKFHTLQGQYYVFECRMMERPEKVTALPMLPLPTCNTSSLLISAEGRHFTAE